MYLRQLKSAFIFWQKGVHNQRSLQSKAQLVIDKIRKQMLLQNFNKYKSQIEFMKRTEKQLGRQDQLIETFNRRILRQQFYAIMGLVNTQKRARGIISIFMNKQQNEKIRRHMFRWKKGAELVKEEML